MMAGEAQTKSAIISLHMKNIWENAGLRLLHGSPEAAVLYNDRRGYPESLS